MKGLLSTGDAMIAEFATVTALARVVGKTLASLTKSGGDMYREVMRVQDDRRARQRKDRLEKLLQPMTETNDVKGKVMRAVAGYLAGESPHNDWSVVIRGAQKAGAKVSEVTALVAANTDMAPTYGTSHKSKLLTALGEQKLMFDALAATREPADDASKAEVRQMSAALDALYAEVLDAEDVIGGKPPRSLKSAPRPKRPRKKAAAR